MTLESYCGVRTLAHRAAAKRPIMAEYSAHVGLDRHNSTIPVVVLLPQHEVPVDVREIRRHHRYSEHRSPARCELGEHSKRQAALSPSSGLAISRYGRLQVKSTRPPQRPSEAQTSQRPITSFHTVMTLDAHLARSDAVLICSRRTTTLNRACGKRETAPSSLSSRAAMRSALRSPQWLSQPQLVLAGYAFRCARSVAGPGK